MATVLITSGTELVVRHLYKRLLEKGYQNLVVNLTVSQIENGQQEAEKIIERALKNVKKL